MKRILFLLAVATFIISSCAKVPEENIEDNIMSFGTSVIETKMITTSGLPAGFTNDRIGIFAHQTVGAFSGNFTPALMENEDLSYSGVWSLANDGNGDPYLWKDIADPERFTFVAYHPRTIVSGQVPSVSSGVLTIPWTVKVDAANQEDLMLDVIIDAYAGDRNGLDDVTPVTTGATSFEFSHLLSKIDFKIKTVGEVAPSPSDIYITKVVLNDVYGTGNYVLGATLAVNPATWATAGTWTATGSADQDHIVYDAGSNPGIQVIGASQVIGDSENSLLMIPQTLASSGTHQLVITYKVGEEEMTQDYSIYTSAYSVWNINTVYTYTFILNATGQVMSFDVSIAAWNTASSNIGVGI